MIVVTYQEEKGDPTTGAISYAALGSESHTNIEEVLLPSDPKPNDPIFFTKKFAGHPEHRWQVMAIQSHPNTEPLTYVITLRRRAQIESKYYLKEIALARGGQPIRKFLHPWSLVEVEFGHALRVGKITGEFAHNKRYVDTVQLYSMPKRRLALVNQVLPRQPEDLIQVIPISSREPQPAERASVEVTEALTRMADYQKRSWAVCRMIQTVTASRVIAPVVKRTEYKRERDTGFGTRIRGEVRQSIKDAIMYGVAADGRVADSNALPELRRSLIELEEQVTNLTAQLGPLENAVNLFERFVKDSGFTVEEVHLMYGAG